MAQKPYTISLSRSEMDALAHATNRGYFPETTWDDLTLRDDQDDSNQNAFEAGEPAVWELSEPGAWALLELRDENPEAYLSCIGGELLNKINTLVGEII